MSSTVVLLGPQRLEPTLGLAVDALGVRGRIAAVTAGWEERESEDQELGEHLGGRTTNLELFRRSEEVYERDAELFAAMRERRNTRHRLRELYRLRLKHALKAARVLLKREGDDPLLEREREEAIRAVRALDDHHLRCVAEIEAKFAARTNLAERPEVARQRSEIERVLAGVDALCIAGGHVGVLIERMRLFDLLPLLGDKPIFAWSAGAMVISERIVLFHDHPPQGAGDAEVFGLGLGVCKGVVPLPHAKHRLRLKDKARVALLARRFRPALCAAMDEAARLDWDGASWTLSGKARRLSLDGTVDGKTA